MRGSTISARTAKFAKKQSNRSFRRDAIGALGLSVGRPLKARVGRRKIKATQSQARAIRSKMVELKLKAEADARAKQRKGIQDQITQNQEAARKAQREMELQEKASRLASFEPLSGNRQTAARTERFRERALDSRVDEIGRTYVRLPRESIESMLMREAFHGSGPNSDAAFRLWRAYQMGSETGAQKLDAIRLLARITAEREAGDL